MFDSFCLKKDCMFEWDCGGMKDAWLLIDFTTDRSAGVGGVEVAFWYRCFAFSPDSGFSKLLYDCKFFPP
jgi:hypothetical protein